MTTMTTSQRFRTARERAQLRSCLGCEIPMEFCTGEPKQCAKRYEAYKARMAAKAAKEAAQKAANTTTNTAGKGETGENGREILQ